MNIIWVLIESMRYVFGTNDESACYVGQYAFNILKMGIFNGNPYRHICTSLFIDTSSLVYRWFVWKWNFRRSFNLMAFSKQTIPFYLYLMNSYQQNRKYTMRYDIAKLNLKQTVNINRNIDRRRELNSFIYCIQSK